MANLHDLASKIWWAGVTSVLGDVCIQRHLAVADDVIRCGGWEMPCSRFRRLIVVGAGKAAGAMADGVALALGDDLLRDKNACGWLNVPAGASGRSSFFHFHQARPPGLNEPTELACLGTQSLLQLVREASPDDLCLCLISGGASSLLVAPAPGITLREKQELTRLLSAAGAGIGDLNTVRRSVSVVKGGGLASACRAGQLLTLVLSDVLGDPLDIIGSGPTIPLPPAPRQALEILDRYGVSARLPGVVSWLRDQVDHEVSMRTELPPIRHVILVGNLYGAMQAAATEAAKHGFTTRVMDLDTSNPTIDREAESLVRQAQEVAGASSPVCIISGGEPVVQLAGPEVRGHGGRNQQFAIAAGIRLTPLVPAGVPWVLLSAGTDGEDGTTEFAGAYWDDQACSKARQAGLDPREFLRRNDSFSFFQRIGGLFWTGPTGTNVCDLRVFVR